MAGTERSPLRDRLAAACGQVEPRLSGTAAAVVGDVRKRLVEPKIRLAVGGRLNAGKSTLVNAMLGQQLAATDATECTRVVAWFRYGHASRVIIRPFAGEAYPRPLGPGGRLPEDLGRPADEIAEVVVETPNAALRSGFTIIDTPGTDTLSGLDDYALDALSRADGLLYVMPHPSARDREVLRSLRATMAGAGLSAANVLGVLSQIDRLGGDNDPWPGARRVAARNAAELRTLVADIVPLLGLVAETALGERFTEEDARLLRRLAAAQAGELDRALAWHEDFSGWHTAPVSSPERERLLGLLGLHGIRLAVALIRGGASDTGALLDGLGRASGVNELLARVQRQFVDRADQLRTATAITTLDQVAWGGENAEQERALGMLRVALAALRREPAVRAVWLAVATHELDARGITLDPEFDDALTALVTGRNDQERLGLPTGASAREVCRAAEERIGRWRELECRAPRALARHARTAREITESLYFAAADTC